MRAILGIGNPGKRYERNRHNVGFMFLDYYAGHNSLTFTASRKDYYICIGRINDNDFCLIKPATYVNSSGIVAEQVVKKYQLDISDLLIVVDDINLPLSEFRVRFSGGDGGHNGLSSIIYSLSSDQFPRLRLGIGSNFSKGEMIDYVLSDFAKDESADLEKFFGTVSSLADDFIVSGFKGMLDANSRISKSN